MTRTRCAALILCLVGTAAPALAQLDPPPGPVAPTFKTLDQVQPRIPLSEDTTPGDADARFIINQPGSYYLAGDLLDVQAAAGILIAADDVTLDLMGFTLAGGEGSEYGVRVSGPADNITIRNGVVTGWGQAGIDLAFTNAAGLGSLIENVRATKNGFTGIYAGVGATVRHCAAIENGGSGFTTFDRGTFEHCQSRLNGGNGFVLRGVGALRDCVADQNDYAGIHTNDTVTIDACTASHNGADGILAVACATVSASSAYANGADGFTLGAGSMITQSTAKGNADHGIAVAAGSTVTSCSAVSNGKNGFSTDTATITGSTARANTEDGFYVGVGGSISNCNAADNAGDGIELAGRTTATGNTCNRNGHNGDGAGIHVGTGGYCRIESNHISENDRGIEVHSRSNTIVRNTLIFNVVPFDVQTGNSVGVIVRAPSSGEIHGTSGAAGMGTTDPWANFVQ